jgi:hypothetical protein
MIMMVKAAANKGWIKVPSSLSFLDLVFHCYAFITVYVLAKS